jgi:hypothetical protein
MPATTASRLRDAGFAFVPAAQMRALLEAQGSLADWSAFTASWNSLEVDEYMADRGRYRRRRHAVWSVRAGELARAPRQPHYQALD